MGKIGNMDRRVEFKSLSSTKSSMGAPVKSYTHYCYRWASREAAGESSERFVNNRLIIAPRYKYRIHRDDTIVETMRIVDDGDTYNILSVNPPDTLFLEILAEKIVE